MIVYNLTKNFQEAPEADSAQHGDRQVVVPAEEIDQFTSRSDDTGDDAHHAKGQWARYHAAR